MVWSNKPIYSDENTEKQGTVAPSGARMSMSSRPDSTPYRAQGQQEYMRLVELQTGFAQVHIGDLK